MVSKSLTSLILTLLILLQAIESFSLNFEDKEHAYHLLKKRGVAYEGHELKGRKMMKMKMMKMKTDELKRSEISASLSAAKSTKTDYRIEKRKMKGVTDSWSSFVNSNPSKSNSMNEFEVSTADYHQPGSHTPGHN